MPPKSTVPPLITRLLAPRLYEVEAESVPAFTVVIPVKLLDPERVRVPVPLLVRPTAPANVAETVPLVRVV